MTDQALLAAKAALDAHQAVRQFEIDNDQHLLVMLLADIVEWADENGLDVALAFEDARGVILDCSA